MYELGRQLMHYRPLTAEHLMWGAFPAAGKGFEDRAGLEVEKVNRGTNPHLTSRKYTGYGIVLRAGVDTPDEISVFLQQIDKGPNYRWGYANQNGSGDIYYYAGGGASAATNARRPATAMWTTPGSAATPAFTRTRISTASA